MSGKKERRLYIASMFLLILFPCVFLLMPIANIVPIEKSRVVNLILGIAFWSTGIFGYGLLIRVYHEERKKGNGRKKRKRRTYLCSNRVTTMADIVFTAGIISFIVLIKARLTASYAAYINLFLIILAFNIHWIFSRSYVVKILSDNTAGGKKQ